MRLYSYVVGSMMIVLGAFVVFLTEKFCCDFRFPELESTERVVLPPEIK